MAINQSALGPWLRSARRRQGLTQQQVAHQVRISASYLSLLERNFVRHPGQAVLGGLAAVLGVYASDLTLLLHTPDRRGAASAIPWADTCHNRRV